MNNVTNRIIKDFPFLQNAKHQGERFVYLDSAATSQKPKAVLEAEKIWYARFNANIHRSSYDAAEQATKLYETVRAQTAQFIGAPNPKSIVFTSSATMGMSLVVQSWARHNLRKGDVIMLTEMEHHANIVPWQMLAKELGLEIRYWPIDVRGKLSLEQSLEGVAVLSLAHVSNVLGTINPIEDIVAQAQAKGTCVVVDGAQAVGHMPVEIKKLSPDFYVFSAHKMLGPTGLGVVYAAQARWNEMQPYIGGGEMIQQVTKEKSTYKPMPWGFEPGTMPLAQVFAFGEALSYLSAIGVDRIHKHSSLLAAYAYKQLNAMPEVAIVGPRERAGLVSFVVQDMHAHDVATLLNEHGVAVRAGHHCAMPLHEVLGESATTRMSFYIYNDKQDVEYAVTTLKRVIKEWKQQLDMITE